MPQIVFILYSFVSLSGVYGFFRVKKFKRLPYFYLAVALMFAFCGSHYLLMGINAPEWLIKDEMWLIFLFAVGLITIFNPFTINRHTLDQEKLRLTSQIHESRAKNSSVPYVVLRFVSFDEAKIVTANTALKDWVYERKICPPTELEPGKNWHGSIRHNSEWKEFMQEAAIGGRRFKDQTAFLQQHNTYIQWALSPLDPEEKLILIEFQDTTTRDLEISELRQAITELEIENQKLTAEILKKIEQEIQTALKIQEPKSILVLEDPQNKEGKNDA